MRAPRILATVAIAALCGCSGAANGGAGSLLPPAHVGQPAATQIRLVGIGDSLTAGFQSGGLVGASVPTPALVPQLGNVFPAGPTQENGFWALLWEAVNGSGTGVVSNSATSPLPLIAPPGLGNLLALTSSGFPLGLNPTPAGSSCNATTRAAYDFATAPSLRLSPSVTPYDVAIPGMTLHEALAMTGPLSTCGAVPTALAGLNALVGSESENFYPILAGFGAGVTQVEAAVALHPQYATVLLGENDLLKPAFSNNGAPVTAPSSFRDDTAAIVAQLRAAGANVLLANLPDPLKAATFIPQPFYTATLAAVLTTSIAQQNPTLPLSNARALAAQTAQFYASAEIAQSGLGAGGYFTINALFATLAAAAQQGPPPTLSPVGDFVSDALAAQTESLLAAYNAAIASVATTKGVALVDLNALNTQASYGAAIQVAPGDFVTATYGGGLYSLDGLHPSNTGYAVIANAFVAAMNRSFGTSVPTIDVDAIYRADPSRFAH